MLNNKKITTCLCAVLAATMFCGVAAVTAEDTSTPTAICVSHGEDVLTLANEPFVENNTVYLPLRELMQTLNLNPEETLNWNNGVITLSPKGHEDYYTITIGSQIIAYEAVTHAANTQAERKADAAPLLVNSLTYIPIEYVDYIFNRYGTNLQINATADGLSMTTGQPFDEDEIAAAKAVIEGYFNAANEKGKRGELQYLTERYDAPNVHLTSDSDVTLTVNDIHYDPYDIARRDYVTTGRGSINETTVDNVIVFKVDYTVTIPEGGDAGAYEPGDRNGWKMILIRKTANDPWLIDDMGY